MLSTAENSPALSEPDDLDELLLADVNLQETDSLVKGHTVNEILSMEVLVPTLTESKLPTLGTTRSTNYQVTGTGVECNEDLTTGDPDTGPDY